MGREREQLSEQDFLFHAQALTADISYLQRQIKNIRMNGKDIRGFSTQMEKRAIRDLHRDENEKITELLLLRMHAGSIVNLPVEIERYPGEKIHPFSKNPAKIYLPSDIDSFQNYYVKFELSDIRKPGLIEDSVKAYEIMVDADESESTVHSFLFRTVLELIKIRDIRNGLINSVNNKNDNPNQPIIENLNQLTADLFTQRLFKLNAGNLIPQNYKVEFYADAEHNEAVAEIIRLSSSKMRPDNTYQFRVPASNIVNSLNKVF